MNRTPLMFLLLVLCLPPSVPPLDTTTRIDRRIIEVQGQRPTEHYMATEFLYRAADGAEYSVLRLLGAAAVVDDEPRNAAALNWWIDPGLLTDDTPARVQAEPKSTCQWRRRGEQAIEYARR